MKREVLLSDDVAAILDEGRDGVGKESRKPEKTNPI